MRFGFDLEKSKRLKANPERSIGFWEVEALFDAEHLTDRRSDDPEQFRAIGKVNGTLYSALWKATKGERRAYAENI